MIEPLFDNRWSGKNTQYMQHRGASSAGVTWCNEQRRTRLPLLGAPAVTSRRRRTTLGPELNSGATGRRPEDAGASPAGLVHRSVRASLRRARGVGSPRAGGGSESIIESRVASERRSADLNGDRIETAGSVLLAWTSRVASERREHGMTDGTDTAGSAPCRWRDPCAAGNKGPLGSWMERRAALALVSSRASAASRGIRIRRRCRSLDCARDDERSRAARFARDDSRGRGADHAGPVSIAVQIRVPSFRTPVEVFDAVREEP